MTNRKKPALFPNTSWHQPLPRLADVLEVSNGYDQVRLLAALAVVISHAFIIAGGKTQAEPLSWAAYDLGAIAVNVFFVLSGMMVSRSFALGPDPRRFILARVLRIYPALIVAAVLTSFMIGPFGTELTWGQYFTSPQTWLYPVNVLWDFAGARLPETFVHNTVDQTNEPLWTIKYELLAYCGLVAVAALGLLRPLLTVPAWVALLIVMLAGWKGTGENVDALQHAVRFAFCFISGVIAHQFGDHVRLSVLVATILVVIGLLLSASPLAAPISILSFGYFALAIGATGHRLLYAVTRHGDFSFGLYLYAWPVQQALMHHVSWLQPTVLFHSMASIAVAGTLAVLSWYLVEKPALALKAPPSNSAVRVVPPT